MGCFATFNPIPTPTLPLKGRELAAIGLKLVPLDADPNSCSQLLADKELKEICKDEK